MNARGLEEITKAVAGWYDIQSGGLLRRRCPHREAHRILMCCGAEYCRHDWSLSDVAEHLGVWLSGLTRARDPLAGGLPRTKNQAQRVQNVVQRLQATQSQ
ncbi:MAG TPA: hypothetical protein EYH34_06190 [Planctomycetes bacterium]|nr:hypothetical protein [Planctomycetota bacterium]